MNGASANIYVQYRALLIKPGPTELDIMQCIFYSNRSNWVGYHLVDTLRGPEH